MTALDLVSFTSIAGVPVHPAPRRIGRTFLATLDTAFEELWTRCPWGRAEKIVHMGAWVNRKDPNGVDRHAQGRAIDIGQIVWAGAGRRVRADDAKRSGLRQARYLACAAVFEHHIGCCLNYWQPKQPVLDDDGNVIGWRDHRSHWHLDDHVAPGWRPAWKPSVRFMQASLMYIYGHRLEIDGVCGPKTLAALTSETGELAPTPSLGWQVLLDRVATEGWR